MHNHMWVSIEGKLRDFPEVGLVECEVCGLVNPEQDLRSQVSYESGTMHVWAQGWGGEHARPSSDEDRRVRAISSKLNNRGYYLDYGCGDGSVLRSLASATANAYGMDPDESATANARRDGLRIFKSHLEVKSTNKKFDVISLFHVVEHFYDVPRELREIKDLLAREGRILIETPNAKDALLSRYLCKPFSRFTYWSHHPNLCTNQFLEEAIEDAGLEVEESTQLQRYGLANHLYWLSNGSPGGHTLWNDMSNLELDHEYEKHLIELGIADTIWIVAKHKD